MYLKKSVMAVGERFASGIARINPALTLLDVMEGQDGTRKVHAIVLACLQSQRDLIGIHGLVGGIRGLVGALEATGKREVKPVAIAHELTPFTHAARQGLIDVILKQDGGHEIRSVIRAPKAKADGQPVPGAQGHIRLGISKENLP